MSTDNSPSLVLVGFLFTMHIEKITYAKIFPTSSFLNERIGIELVVLPGEDAKEALRVAKQLAEEFNRESNPNLYKHNKEPLTSEEAAIVKGIELCESVEQLATLYKRNLTANIKPYYMDKIKTLTENFTNKTK